MALIGVIHWQISSVEQQLLMLQKERAISDHSVAIDKSIKDIYLLLIIYGASQSEFALERLDASVKNVNQELRAIKSIRRTGDTKSVRKLENSLIPVLERINKIKASIDSESEIAGQLPHFYAELNLLQDLTSSSLESFRKSQSNMQSRLEMDRLARTRALQITLAIGLALNVAMSLAVATVIARFVNKRLQVVVDNAVRVTRGEPLLPALRGHDEIAHLDATFRLMTDALALAEKRERDLIDNSTDLICSIDAGGSIVEISASAINFLGIEPETLRSQRFASILRPEDRTETHSVLQSGKETGLPFSFETKLPNTDLPGLELQWSARWNEENKMFFMVGHDVTERKQAERLKQEILGMVTHDIRTPLMTVDASLDILEKLLDSKEDKESKAAIKRARKAGDKVLSLAQDFLELDKLDSGMTRLNFEDADLKTMLSEAVDLASGAAPDKMLKFKIKCESGKCACDQRRIVQVLVNLLSNSAKFSPQDGEIVLSVRAEPEKFVFSVQDNGPGIPENLLPHVFDRYTQTHREKASRIGGTGLGLTICDSLVRLHHGEIWVESREGEGANFCFSIPR
jgi:PAS domain S-box-containing protein